MKPIQDYEILYHGVDHPDYFQGCGTSLTSFTDVATGIGVSESEALNDAFDQLAMSDWDVEGNADLVVECDAASEEDQLEDYCKEYNLRSDECDAWVYVSVRVK